MTDNLEKLKLLRDNLINFDSESGEGKLLHWAVEEIIRLNRKLDEADKLIGKIEVQVFEDGLREGYSVAMREASYGR